MEGHTPKLERMFTGAGGGTGPTGAASTSHESPGEENSRGCRGCCFGWIFRLFRRRRKRRSEEHLTDCDVNDAEEEKGVEKEEEKQQEEEVELKAVLSWADEVNEAEEKGQDVFAPYSDALLEVLSHFPPDSDAAVSDQGEAETDRVTATPAARRRARRKAKAAAFRMKNMSGPSHAATTVAATTTATPETTAPREGAAAVATATTDRMSATQRRRARRKAQAAALGMSKKEAEPTWPETRPYRTPAWPSPSVRVFGRDGRPIVCAWEDAAYGAFHAQRHTQGSSRGGRGVN